MARPRIHAELSAGGAAASRKRVARVMRAAGIAGVSRRRGPRTTRRAVRVRPAPDRVARRFEAAGPNRLWVADVTYVPTLAGFLYLAVVLDVSSRRVVGWAMAALECELLDRTKWATHAEARSAVFAFIEGWYNTRRRHSALGYLSPLDFERLRETAPADGDRPGKALKPAVRVASGAPAPAGVVTGVAAGNTGRA